GGGRVPDARDVTGHRPDAGAFGVGEQPGAGGGEPVVFLAEALTFGHRLFPVAFQLADHQPVLRFGELVLTPRPLHAVIGAFQALDPDAFDLAAAGGDLVGRG